MKRHLKYIKPDAIGKPRKRAVRCKHWEVRRLKALVASLQTQVTGLQTEVATLKEEKKEALAENAALKRNKAPAIENQEVCLEKLPRDVIKLIIHFLSEFEKFQLRGLNGIFYEAYYNQTFARRTGTNYMRVARLGALGRCFPRLTHLRIYYDSLDQHFLRFVDKKRFPNMELFAVEKFGTEVDLTKLPGHPKIKTMGLYNMEPQMLKHVTEANFPKLELLDFYPFKCRFLENFLIHLQPHPRLKRIEFLYVYHLDIDDWKVIDKKRFPSLETILYRKPPRDEDPNTQYAHPNNIPEVKEYLKEQGVDFRPEEIPEDAKDNHNTQTD